MLAVALVLLFGASELAASGPTQVPTAPPAAPSTPTEATARMRRILPDGTIETVEPDGKVRRTTPDEVPVEPMGPGSTLSTMDPPTREKYLESLRRYYDYRIQGYEQRQKTFAWQLFSSRIIFWAVLFLVFAGIYFAAVQFHVGLRRPLGPAGQIVEVTELAASAEGIKVSSPVLGVIILVISLVFFYLYLAFVYPISEIF
jgi:hypothetical protein